jgi:hypothetical protein
LPNFGNIQSSVISQFKIPEETQERLSGRRSTDEQLNEIIFPYFLITQSPDHLIYFPPAKAQMKSVY